MSRTSADRSVAVIIPTYNHAHFLAAAIDSVLAQTVPADEIIVVDDGSHDNPQEVTSRYAKVRLIRQENRGLAGARNTGLGASNARFIMFLDADDRLLPEAIARNLDLLTSDEEAGIAYGGYWNVDAASGEKTPARFRAAPRRAFGAFLRFNQIGMHATVMYRRDALESVGCFREGLPACEDHDVYLRIAQRFPIVCRPDMLAEYWRHDESMSRNSALMLGTVLHVLGTYRAEARKAGLMRDYRAGIANWKHFYCWKWAEAAQARPGDPDIALQGRAIMRMAPAHFVYRRLAELARKWFA